MSQKKNLDPFKEYIIKRFCYENATDFEIAEEITDKGYYVAESKVCTYRHENKIKRLHRDEDWLTEQFSLSNKNASQVARLINCNPSTIRKAWVKLGLDTFTSYQVYNVNNIFRDFTSESCYWAGFINADGHIETYCGYGRNKPNYKLRIQLGLKDESHLAKLSKLLVGVDKTKERSYSAILHPELSNELKTYFVKEFRISNKQICLDLIKRFNIKPQNKSMSELPPYSIPSYFVKDYIRGYFDGDGCIGIISKNGQQGIVTIVGGQIMCYFIKSVLSAYYNEEIGHIRTTKTPNLYAFVIYDKIHIIMFYLYIYQNNGSFLKRKKDIFEKIFESNNIRYSLTFNEN